MSDEVYHLLVAKDLERQLPNLKFLTAADCNLETGLAAAEARVRYVIAVYTDDSDREHWVEFQTALGVLRRTR